LKDILLVGDAEGIGSVLASVDPAKGFRILKAKDAVRAIKLLKKISPDFVLCVGRIRKNGEGKYFLEL